MLKPSEKAKIAEHLDHLFKTFQSSRSIAPEAVVYFVEDVAEFSVRAIEETIVRFRRGEVADRNPAFAPSVAEFVSEVRAKQEALDVEAFWDKTDFIEADSPTWKALCEARGGSMPRVERRGIVGWYVPKDEVALVQSKMLVAPQGAISGPIPVPKLKGMDDA